MSTLKNFYDMSDEEFDQVPLADLVANSEQIDQDPQEDIEEASQEEEIESNSDSQENTKEEAEIDAEEALDQKPDTEIQEDVEIDSKDTEAPLEDSPEEENKQEVDPPEELDYKSQYEEVLKPFKANGKEMKVDNVEDVRTLMQQGANYNKKMAALKPGLKAVKLLEKHGLLNEDKLNYLIDLSEKNPKAIQQLIKESKIDPLEIDVESEEEYVASKREVTDKEMALDDVLRDIQDSPEFDKTLDIVANQWDEQSKEIFVDNPSMLKQLNQHIEDGIYNTIQNEIDRQKVLGRLEGLTDFQAYKQVGDEIDARGGFNTQPQSKSPSSNVNAKTKVDPIRHAKRQAARTTEGSVRVKAKATIDPINMSDEEFEKAYSKEFS